MGKSVKRDYRVTGVSKLDFVPRFTTNPSESFENGNFQPMQGITTHALVQPTGIDFERDGIIESVALLDIRGVEIGHYSISILNENLLLAEPFRPPDVRRVKNHEKLFWKKIFREPYEIGQFHFYKSLRTEFSDRNESSLNLIAKDFLSPLRLDFKVSGYS